MGRAIPDWANPSAIPSIYTTDAQKKLWQKRQRETQGERRDAAVEKWKEQNRRDGVPEKHQTGVAIKAEDYVLTDEELQSLLPKPPEPTPIPEKPQAPIQSSIETNPTPVPEPQAPPAQAPPAPVQQQQPQQIPQEPIPWTTGSGQYSAMGVNSGLLIGDRRKRYSSGGFFGRGAPRLISDSLNV